MKTLTQKITEARKLDEAKDNELAKIIKKFGLSGKEIQILTRDYVGANSKVIKKTSLKKGFTKDGPVVMFKSNEGVNIIVTIDLDDKNAFEIYENGENNFRVEHMFKTRTQLMNWINEHSSGTIYSVSEDKTFTKTKDKIKSKSISLKYRDKVPSELEEFVYEFKSQGNFSFQNVPRHLEVTMNDFVNYINKRK